MKFVPVRVSTLRPGVDLLFDVYVEYKDVHLKYRHVQEKFTPEILGQFKAKKIKKVFIPEEQEPLYLKFLDQALNQLQEKSAKVEDRAEMAQDALRRESENIGKTLESEEAYRSSESRIHQVVDFMRAEPKALANMLTSAGLSIDDSSHGSTVSSLCLAIGVQSKYLGREELTDVAVAGLLHDMALKELGFDLKSDLETVAKDDKAKFRTHPAVAIEKVAGKKFITPRVMRLISDHEEYGDGLGFPEKKRYSRLATDSQIFNLCDAFDHFCIKSGKTAIEAVDSFVEARADHFDLGLIEILEKQVKENVEKLH
jgi:HD-GYP domain-containing protein (c-di-GMP phosphodiesterase class II)